MCVAVLMDGGYSYTPNVRMRECVSPPQKTGWSAVFFAAERGDAATTQALIKAGANPHLRDRVCVSNIV